ncbi:MAG: transketolase [Anaerolineae bacterium]
MTAPTAALEQLAINTVRFLAVDAVQQANSGHPGLPLGAAPMAYALWMRYLRHNPRNPRWDNRDRFVLSAGHGSMLLYALLHLTGYDLPLDEIKRFRQWGSKTPGHPEVHLTPGVETTTGPLGQGISNGVGLALAEAFLAAKFNRPNYPIVDHYTYVLASDGDMMEGVASEAASLAGHLKLGKLIVLYDDNKVMLSNFTEAAFSEDVLKRFEAYGWHTQQVEDGNSLSALNQAIESAVAESERPSLIAVRTVIGYGSPNKQGTHKAHGEPLGEEEVKLTKAALGWNAPEPFYIPGNVLEHFREAVENGARFEAEWNALFEAYANQFPAEAAAYKAAMSGTLPEGWDKEIPVYGADTKPMATRDANGAALNAIAKHIPTMIGGDADLSSSTKTVISGSPIFSATHREGRNLQFGVREHGMGAIINGLALHGGIIKPYTATFMTFSDYMRPTIRLAAIMEIAPIFIFTHDSIGVGEDGPTHQPVEQLAALRAIPHLKVFRPGDANESSATWRQAMLEKGPCVLIFTRQKVPVFAPEGIQEGVARGAYIKADSDGTPQVILMASGSEVSLAMAAHKALTDSGVKARVVSMPCWELFDAQDQAYRDSVLLPQVTARVAIEAGVALGWHKYVGSGGKIIALDRFGASAPYEVIYRELGLTAEAVIAAARSLIQG